MPGCSHAGAASVRHNLVDFRGLCDDFTSGCPRQEQRLRPQCRDSSKWPTEQASLRGHTDRAEAPAGQAAPK
eukprot:453744-Alexandrium_andersonii.AAC.1